MSKTIVAGDTVVFKIPVPECSVIKLNLFPMQVLRTDIDVAECRMHEIESGREFNIICAKRSLIKIPNKKRRYHD
jgi:hypothetical protein